ncbi:antitoxin YezG family protein [Bacillus safensis]|uniref:antitoxin YezG family protein n=1 Tax=Bacillus safensis TaxID=561879 RepID=UPI002075BF57|nr:antitoxin YezG family protein [Bacillus safensis]USD84441.1 antitoxin YezG family protein [Bacillus safensis]
MEHLYKSICESINEMIPSDWDRVVLYAEILEDSREVYFFFNTKQNQDYIYSHDIPRAYGISKQEYITNLNNLQELFKELRNQFKKNEQDLWTNLTLHLDCLGNLKIEYDYMNILNSVFSDDERQLFWEYEHLGILPEDEEDKEIVLNYIKNKDNN